MITLYHKQDDRPGKTQTFSSWEKLSTQWGSAYYVDEADPEPVFKYVTAYLSEFGKGHTYAVTEVILTIDTRVAYHSTRSSLNANPVVHIDALKKPFELKKTPLEI